MKIVTIYFIITIDLDYGRRPLELCIGARRRHPVVVVFEPAKPRECKKRAGKYENHQSLRSKGSTKVNDHILPRTGWSLSINLSLVTGQ